MLKFLVYIIHALKCRWLSNTPDHTHYPIDRTVLDAHDFCLCKLRLPFMCVLNHVLFWYNKIVHKSFSICADIFGSYTYVEPARLVVEGQKGNWRQIMQVKKPWRSWAWLAIINWLTCHPRNKNYCTTKEVQAKFLAIRQGSNISFVNFRLHPSSSGIQQKSGTYFLS